MKKYLFLASAATLLLASCSDDFAPNNGKELAIEGKSVIYATISNEIDTRTEAVPSGNTFAYAWNQGDAMGLYGTNVTNAQYINVSPSGESGKFVGQVNLKQGNTYYAYYPFSQTQSFSENKFTMAIPAIQNFNYSNFSTSDELVAGSFSQGEVPAVAVAEATEDDVLEFQLNPLVCYMRFPLTGYGTVTSVTLQVLNSESKPYTLAGSTTIDPTNIGNGIATTALGEEAENQTITIETGNGVELNSTNPVWFWFVVPTGMNLSSGSAKITVNGSLGSQSYTKTFAETAPTTQINTPYNLGTATSPYNYSGTSYVITNQKQFLEYAYLATSWSTAVENYFKIADSYEAENDDDADQIIAEYTDFLNMVNPTTGVTTPTQATQVQDLKPALIVNDITFDPEAIEAWLNGEGNGLPSTPEAATRAGAYPNEPKPEIPAITLPAYLQGAFGNYAENGYLAPIGGGTPASFIGGDEAAQINGLEINGNGMFGTATTTNTITADNLVFTNCKVTNTGNVEYGYFFYNVMGAGNALIMSDITVDTTCSLSTVKGALFNSCYSAWISNVLQYIESKPSSLAYFNVLNVNTRCDLSSFDLASDFHSIIVKAWIPNVCAVKIANQEQAEQFLQIADIQKNGSSSDPNTLTYCALYDDTTSYWTGSAFSGSDGYAENLAALVQSGTTGTFTMKMNLNLMGSYGDNAQTVWWTNSTNNPAYNISLSSDYTISNIYIDGENNIGTYKALTLFGFTGYTSGNGVLTVDDITIDGSNENSDQHVGALWSLPSTENACGKVVVTDMNVINTNSYWGAVGGLYAVVNSGTLANSNYANSTCSFGSSNAPNPLPQGWLAGYIQYTANTANNWIIDNTEVPALNGVNAFGISSVVVYGSTTSDTVLLTLKGYNLSGSFTVGTTYTIIDLGSVQVSAATTNSLFANGNTLNIPFGDGNQFYQFEVVISGGNTQFQYKGILQGAAANAMLKAAKRI